MFDFMFVKVRVRLIKFRRAKILGGKDSREDIEIYLAPRPSRIYYGVTPLTKQGCGRQMA